MKEKITTAAISPLVKSGGGICFVGRLVGGFVDILSSVADRMREVSILANGVFEPAMAR